MLPGAFATEAWSRNSYQFGTIMIGLHLYFCVELRTWSRARSFR